VKSETVEEPQDIKDRTFDFATRVVRLSKSLEKDSRTSATLANQLLRSGTSIGANTEEAYGSQSRADFTAKMYIACKEARETHYWLRLLASAEIVPESKLADLIDESNQLVAIITTIVINSKRNGGSK